MKSLFLLSIISVMTISSCGDKEVEAPITNGHQLPSPVEIVYLNKEGKNLLDGDMENAIIGDVIKIYYLLKGDVIEFSRPSYDRPKGYVVLQTQNDTKYLAANVNTEDMGNNKITTTLIDFGNGDIDTIKTELLQENGIFIQSIWYNGVKQMLNQYRKEGYDFQIVK